MHGSDHREDMRRGQTAFGTHQERSGRKGAAERGNDSVKGNRGVSESVDGDPDGSQLRLQAGSWKGTC